MFLENILERESLEWLIKNYEELPTELKLLLPSEWAEQNRYLPPSVSPLPGPYSFDVAPFLIEIVDNLSPFSPIRQIDVLKGVQTCFTVGVIENAIGYLVDYIKDAPSMFLTADADLAKIRIEQYITPMLDHSGLYHLIRSSDENNTRKTGKTDKKIEWEGGGFLVPFGAQSANKLRSISIQYLFEDEIDSYPQKIGKDGDPLKLAEDRTASYEASRKIVRGSTPLILETSKAWREHQKGDQREYHVPCKHCGHKQKLIWHGVHPGHGTVHGMVWKYDSNGLLKPDTVRYICENCHGEWVNSDKTWMYRDRGAYCEWVPSAIPISPDRRSYHLPAMYSPVGMQTWEAQVRKFLEAYDPREQRTIDIHLYQVFRNNVEGLPFETQGQKLKLETVMENRNAHYTSGMIPNSLALSETGSRILVLTCAVDVHDHHLDVLVEAVTAGGRTYSIEWVKFKGSCEDINDVSWKALEEFIDTKTYKSDDGFSYRPRLTVIDSGHLTDQVYKFCNMYASGVVAIKGVPRAVKGRMAQPFYPFKENTGVKGFNITGDMYKDRLKGHLEQHWGGRGHQPPGHRNYPSNYSDEFFRELTRERRVQVKDATTGEVIGMKWHRPGNAANHAWDLSVYCTAALDMLAFEICITEFGLDAIHWDKFYEFMSAGIYTVEGSFGEKK